jgi:acetoin:2,6-dichlorophenolindophenol oxidoreductase subunit beta
MRTDTDAGVEPVELAYRHAICAALDDELASDPSVVFFGEDVASAGGVFKTNDGLVERHGAARVFNTPICENAFIGMALGMAVTGLRPVVEIMFSDFLPTAADALMNELPKFRFMSGGQTVVPVTVRAMGGGTGRFGTQHSATGESWYMGLPGLNVATASTPAAIYATLRAAIRSQDPTLVIEHKALFNRRGPVVRSAPDPSEIGRAELLRSGGDATVVGTLLMAQRALEAAEALAAEGVELDVIDLRWIRPLDVDAVHASVERTGRLVVIEEQHHAGGWGATLISELVRRGVQLEQPPSVVGLADNLLVPYPPSLEDQVIPSVERIADACRVLVGQPAGGAVR